jgi:Na+/H+ antiporter NhaD/arsenite permease-like protein
VKFENVILKGTKGSDNHLIGIFAMVSSMVVLLPCFGVFPHGQSFDPMNVAILVIFLIGYVLITLENSVRINKAAFALVTGVICWSIYLVSEAGSVEAGHALKEQVAEIAEILFFLIGAMTIVELIDLHGGFDLLTAKIRTRKKVVLLWVVSGLAFFLSAILDNLATAIVMTSVVAKLVDDRKDRLWFVGMIVIACNAGGAWSPLGDVTTTMLWVQHKVTADAVVVNLILPSLACLLVPLVLMSFLLKGTLRPSSDISEAGSTEVADSHRLLVLVVGLLCLFLVPVFKVLFHLAPFMGMMLSLGMIWIFTEVLHGKRFNNSRRKLSPTEALERIDTPSLLFFLGILLAVGALQVTGQLAELATWLDHTVPDRNVAVMIIGLLSAVIDNVPMVAGALEMYPIEQFPLLGENAAFWHFLAYCAGTGGSILIIGSAAGVAVMGIEKVEFFWYVKRMSLLALLGYLGGAGVFLLMQHLGLLVT